MTFEDLAVRLERAKDAYRQSIKQIDAALKPMVAVQPELLKSARDFQKDYAVAPDHAAVKLLEQPEDMPAQASSDEGHKGKGKK